MKRRPDETIASAARWATALLAVAGSIVLSPGARAQVVTLNQTFTNATAPGWVLGGGANLTANGGGDPAGSGWLQLSNNTGNESTYAYDSTSFASANATITATFSIALFNSTTGDPAADGITFFLANANVLPANGGAGFTPGAYGGSLGYAQKTAAGGATNIAGMTGGYLGIGIDSFGNYSNPTEGRAGGPGFVPNAIAVRGPGSGLTGYNYLGGTDGLSQALSYPGQTTRPTGSQAETVQMVLTSTNQLTVSIEFGNSGVFVTEFTADLSSYTRPNDLIMGFTGGTGSYTETEEVQGLTLTSITANLWTSSGGDGNWNTANNWYGVPSGAVPLAGSDVLLDNTYVSTAQAISVGSNQVIRSLQIDAPFGYTLTGGSLEFNTEGNGGQSGIIVTQTNGAAVQTVNSNLQADNAIVIENNSASALNLGGTLATGGFPVNFNGTGTVTESGVVSGTGSVYETGTGTTTLSGANTYSGGTTISSGTLNANNNAALGTGSVVLSGGTLGSTNTSTVSNAISLQGSAALSGITTSGALTQSGGSYTLNMANATQSGTVALSNTNTAQTLTTEVDSGTSAINGVISNGGTGAGGLTKIGSGTLTLGAVNTYTGATTVSAGTLQLGVSNAINSNSSLALDNGTLELAGKSVLVNGFTFANGTIDFGSGSPTNAFVFTGTASGTGILTIDNYNNSSTVNPLTKLADTTATGAASILSQIYFAGIGSGAVQQSTQTATGEGNDYLIVPNTTFLTWNGAASGTSSNWSSANWVSGVPSLTVGSTQKLDFTGTVGLSPAMQASYSANAIAFDSAAGTFNVGLGVNTLTLDGIVPSIIQSSNNNETISGTGALAFTANGVIDVGSGGGSGNLTISAPITGTGSITKLDAGTLFLSGNNSGYSGAIGVQAGTLAVSGSNNVLGTSTTTVSSGATLDVTSGLTITNGLSLSGAGYGGTAGALESTATSTLSGGITLAGNATVNSTAGTLTLSGVIAGGTNGLTLEGAGTTTLSGLNTYTGATTVNAGTVNLSAAGASVQGNLTINGGTVNDTASGQLGAATNLAVNGGTYSLGSSTESVLGLSGVPGGVIALGTGTLTVNDTGNSTFGGTLTGTTGTLDKESTGGLTLTGTNSSFTGTVKVDNGVVLADGTNVTGATGSTVIIGNSSNGDGNSGNFEVEGGVSLASKFTLSSSSTSTTNGSIENVSGNNTISGAITETTSSRIQSDSGTLTLSGNAALGATTLDVGGNSNTVMSGVISGTGAALTKDGTGELTLGSANTYTGATTISAGTLLLNAAGAVSGNTLTASGGTVQLGATNAIGSGVSLALNNSTLSLAGNSVLVGGFTFNNGTIDFGSGSTNAFVFTAIASGTGILTIDNYNNSSTTNPLTKLADTTATGAASILGDIYFAGVGSGAIQQSTTTATGEGNDYLIVPNTAFLTWNGGGFGSNWSTGNNWVGGTAPVTTAGSTQKVEFAGTTKLAPVMNNNYSVNAVEFASGSGAFNVGLGTNTLTLDGPVPSIIQASNSNETISGTGAVAMSANGVIDVGSGGATGTLTISAPISGTGSITKLDAGTLLLSGNNSGYSGAIDVTAGTVSVSGSSNVLGTGSTTVSSGATLDVSAALTLTNALTLAGTGASSNGALESDATSTLSGAIALTGATTIDSTAGTLTLSGGITGTGDNLTLGGAGNTTVSSSIGTSSGTVTLNGTGTTTFSAANSYTGLTTVNSGTLNLSDTTGITVDGNLTVAGGTVNDNDSGQLGANTNLTVNSGTYALVGATTAATVNSLSGTGGTVSLGTGALTDNQTSTTSYSGAISGTTGTFTKAGTGSLTISGANTYTGATTVTGGTLVLGSAISSTAVAVNGGTLQTNVNNALVSTAAVTVLSGGTLNINGTSESFKSLADAGTLAFGAASTLTLSSTSAASSTLNGSITGSGTLVIGANETVTLGASFDDPNLNITLAGGTLKLNGTTDTFGNLSVSATSSLDFANGAASILTVNGVAVTGGTQLSVTNWTNGVDYFYSLANPGAQGSAPTDLIVFTGYTGANTRWNSGPSGPDNLHEITPAPEPATYGAIFVGISLLGIVIYRRRRTAA